MDRRGQAMVETAIVLPMLVFTFLILYQLILQVGLKIRLVRQTFDAAQMAAIGERAVFFPVSHDSLAGWKPYAGVATLSTPGRLVSVQLYGRHAGWTQHAVATFMEEPRVPGDPS